MYLGEEREQPVLKPQQKPELKNQSENWKFGQQNVLQRKKLPKLTQTLAEISDEIVQKTFVLFLGGVWVLVLFFKSLEDVKSVKQSLANSMI